MCEDLVRLSVASGVLCRFTSFVAVDSDGQTIAKRSLASNNHDISSLCLKEYNLCSFEEYNLCCSPLYGSSKVHNMKRNVGRVLMRSCYLVDQCLTRLYYRMASPQAEGDLRDPTQKETTSAKDAVGWLNPTTASQMAPPQPDGDLRDPIQDETSEVMLKLIESQSFNGSWTLQDISKILDVQIQDLEPMANEVRLSTYFSFDGYWKNILTNDLYMNTLKLPKPVFIHYLIIKCNGNDTLVCVCMYINNIYKLCILF